MSSGRTPNPGNQSVYIMEDGMDEVCAAALDQQTVQNPTVSVPFAVNPNYYSQPVPMNQIRQTHPSIIYQGKLFSTPKLFFNI